MLVKDPDTAANRVTTYKRVRSLSVVSFSSRAWCIEKDTERTPQIFKSDMKLCCSFHRSWVVMVYFRMKYTIVTKGAMRRTAVPIQTRVLWVECAQLAHVQCHCAQIRQGKRQAAEP